MVELVALVKGTFQKFKLRAEVAVLDHDATKRQKLFGVELFDLIEKQKIDIRAQIEKTMDENKSNANTTEKETKPSEGHVSQVENFLKVFQTIENEITGPLEGCRADIAKMTESNFLPLLIKRRKEEFGVEIWPIVSSPKWLHESLEGDLKKALEDDTVEKNNQLGNLMNVAIKGVVKGTKTTLTKAIGKLSPEEREVETCVMVAKEEVAVFEQKRTEKLTEIEDLVSGGTTLECC
jgi:hypothetical protein